MPPLMAMARRNKFDEMYIQYRFLKLLSFCCLHA